MSGTVSYAARVASVIDRVGQDITFRSRGANSFTASTGVNTVSYTDYTVKASVRHYSPREIAGLVQAGDREVRIAADALAATPKKDDLVTIGAFKGRVVEVITRSPKGTNAVHILTVRGAP